MGQCLFASGGGGFAESTYTSTYSSALATQTALYQGDGTKATYKAVLISDGLDSATADNRADQYCHYLAVADATRAAQTAADAASSWVTVTSYGSGANPKIQPGSAINGGIEFGRIEPIVGGWKILNVDIDAAKVGGILYDRGAGTPKGKGLWVEGCKITNCTGMPIGVNGAPTTPPYYQFCSTGITAHNIDYMRWKDVEITGCDEVGLVATADCWISGCYFHDTPINSLFFGAVATAGGGVGTPTQRLLFETTECAFLGDPTGYSRGEAGPQITHVTDSVFLNLNSHDIKLHHSDAVAFDIEDHDAAVPWTLLIKDCNLHNCNGAAFLKNAAVTDTNARIMIDNCTLNTNGQTLGVPAVMVTRAQLDEVLITRCAITKIGPTQKMFSLIPGGALSNTPPPGTNIIFGPSNTVV